jgi:hypothetical protein
VHSNLGSASLIEAADLRGLGKYTRQVFDNNGWDRLRDDRMYVKGEDGRSWRIARSRKAKAVPLPDRLGEPSVFKHVFYIIKENRTYDQVFGALPQGNGDPALVQFGREVTPNQHAIAEQFVLFDNLYDSGSNSADEMNPAMAALSGVQLEWAVACDAMDFSRPDVAGEDLLNRAIWYATKGFDVPYPGDGRVLRPSEVEVEGENERAALERPRRGGKQN